MDVCRHNSSSLYDFTYDAWDYDICRLSGGSVYSEEREGKIQ